MSIPNAAYPSRFWSCLLTTILIAVIARPTDAQILVWPPEPEEAEESEKEQTEKRLQFDAAAEPEPALRYRFWTAPAQETSGNVMTMIQRANLRRLEQRVNRPQDEYEENYEQWMTEPLDESTHEAIRQYLTDNKSVLAELHRAASMKESKYEIGFENLSLQDVINFSLTDFQNSRDLARLLALEVRLAIAEQRYEDAIRSLRSGFRIAETVGQASDFLIGRLVGFAITGLMMVQVQEMITHPNSPNLYWALASLPPSIWETRRALEYELDLNGRIFPRLADLPHEDSNEGAWRDRLIESVSDFLMISMELDDHILGTQLRSETRLVAGALIITFDGSARNFLRENGHSSDEVEAISPSEAVLRATRARLLSTSDDYFKWVLLPPSMSESYLSEADESLRPVGALPDPAQVLAGLLMPAVEATQSAAVRSEQSIAFLATVEALRMHAAEHSQFPETLENLQPVPAFLDPATGELFEYKKISNTEANLERKPAHAGQPDTKLRLELRE